MELDAYTRAALEKLRAAGFAPMTPALSPPGAADFSLPLLGLDQEYVAIVPGAGRLTAEQRRSAARAWASWAQQSAGAGAAPLRLILVYVFRGDLDAGVQAGLAGLTAAGTGWDLSVWAVDPTVHFLGTYPLAEPERPALRALLAAAVAAAAPTPSFGGRRSRGDGPDFTPWLTYGLLGACIGLFLLITLLNRDLGATGDAEIMLHWGAQFAPFVWEGEHWRLIAAMFLHWGILHLAMNSYALYLLGGQVEYLFGRWRYLVIYLVAGIAGNVLSLFLLGAYSPSAGASGAIFGLFGAFLYLKIGTPLGQRMHWRPLLEVLGINTVISPLPGVDLWGHLGGFLGGLLASFAVGLPGAGGRTLRRAAGAVLLLASLAVVTPWVDVGPRGVTAFHAGMRARNAEAYDDAIKAFEAAVAINPDLGRYHLRLGEAYALVGDGTGALRETARAVELAPADWQAKDYLARLRQSQR